MYDSFLVRKDSLMNVVKDGETVGFKFAVQLANYRGIYLSLVNGFYVNIRHDHRQLHPGCRG